MAITQDRQKNDPGEGLLLVRKGANMSSANHSDSMEGEMVQHSVAAPVQSNAVALSLDSLAQMLVLVWRVERETNRVPEWNSLRTVFIDNWSSVPSSIKNLLHIQGRISGDVLREETDIIVAAQRGAVLSRVNYLAKEQIVRFNMLSAIDRLKDFRVDFPEEVAWLREKISKLAVH